MKTLTLSLLSASLAALLAGHAWASDPGTSTQARELAQAREDLRRAARRIAELSQDQHQATVAARASASAAERRPMIGVLLRGDEQPGVRITGVTPDGPAAKAGLRSGDRLVAIEGTQVLGASSELRMENARRLLAKLPPERPAKLVYQRGGRASTVTLNPVPRPRALAFSTGDGRFEWVEGDEVERGLAAARHGLHASAIALESVPGIAPDVRREIMRISREGPCAGEDCRSSGLLSAFRWQGLNLASLDPQLGRYFGTDRGVLVLTTGQLQGLQAGDVIQRVDGKAVATPREVMALLQGRSEGSQVGIDYVRDRRNAQARVAVPRIPALPPAPPAPPARPAPPKAAPPPPPAAPPAPPRPPVASTVAGHEAPQQAIVEDLWLVGRREAPATQA